MAYIWVHYNLFFSSAPIPHKKPSYMKDIEGFDVKVDIGFYDWKGLPDTPREFISRFEIDSFGSASPYFEYRSGPNTSSYVNLAVSADSISINTPAETPPNLSIFQWNVYDERMSYSERIDYYSHIWRLIEVDVPELFTKQSDIVDFNKLTEMQRLSIIDYGYKVIRGGGNDKIYLPNIENQTQLLQEGFGEDSKLRWLGQTTFHTDSKRGNVCTVVGGNGNDKIAGGYGKDILSGEGGNDILDASFGASILTGGAGRDTFYVDNEDTIRDLHFGEQVNFWGEGMYVNIRPVDKSFTKYEIVSYSSPQNPAEIRPKPTSSVQINLDKAGNLEFDHSKSSGYWIEAGALEPWQKLLLKDQIKVASKPTEDPGLEQLFRVNPDILEIIDDVAAAYRAVLGKNYILNITDVERPTTKGGQHPHSNALDFGIKYAGTNEYISNAERTKLIKIINKDKEIPDNFLFFLSTKYNGGPITSVDPIKGTRIPGDDQAIFEHHHHLHVQAPAGYDYDWTP